jgi:hypothetical protein
MEEVGPTKTSVTVSTRLHGATTQKRIIFITPVVSTSNVASLQVVNRGQLRKQFT